VLHGQLPERFFQGPERLEVVGIAADEYQFFVFDVGDRTEAVVLQFEDVVGIVDGLAIRVKRMGWMRRA
jgi:hypothetical protein